MLTTVALWLATGAGLSVIAWQTAPMSFPAGVLSCVIAGVGGAFVGGELFVVLGGPVHDHPDVVTVLGSTAGGLLFLDLAIQAAEPRGRGPADSPTSMWLSLVLWSPVLFTVAITAALARANDSPALGLAATISVVLFVVLWHQHHQPRTRDR